MQATAFSPGHISGFFQPVYYESFYQTGSRGAGINLSHGVTATVCIESDSIQTVEVYVDNKIQVTPVVTNAIKQVLRDSPFHVRIDLYCNLPVSQGFGMSAAGSLSATYAVASLIKIPFEDAGMAAHRAEIELKTGLGDVAAEIGGGVEIRKTPGVPPWGDVIRIPGDWEIVCCTVDKRVSTSDVLSDETVQNKVQLIGKECTDRLLQNPSTDQLFALSMEFTKRSGLASEKILEVMGAVKPFGKCSMCMLGNSVFAIGDTKKISEVLSSYGTVLQCSVDQQGVRLVD